MSLVGLERQNQSVLFWRLYMSGPVFLMIRNLHPPNNKISSVGFICTQQAGQMHCSKMSSSIYTITAIYTFCRIICFYLSVGLHTWTHIWSIPGYICWDCQWCMTSICSRHVTQSQDMTQLGPAWISNESCQVLGLCQSTPCCHRKSLLLSQIASSLTLVHVSWQGQN